MTRDDLRAVLKEELQPLRAGFENMIAACFKMVQIQDTMGAKLMEIEEALTKPAGPSEAVKLLREIVEGMTVQTRMFEALATHIGMDFAAAEAGGDTRFDDAANGDPEFDDASGPH